MFNFILRLFGRRSDKHSSQALPPSEDAFTRSNQANERAEALQMLASSRSSANVGPASAPIDALKSIIPAHLQPGKSIRGRCFVIDGDTIIISGTHIRLTGIDAPELGDPYGKIAKYALTKLCKGQSITATIGEGMTYDRVVAKCVLPDGTDLSAEMVQSGLALDWAKYSGGEYRYLEPHGVRKKLWRVALKQNGRLNKKAS